ncbi:MAG: response regulator transcription factor [Actinobacteria bacterium]|nr:response regulator transcription factor [Actinomycetota bacterium]
MDDADGIRQLVRIFLERDGRFDVVAEATDGRTAIDVVAAEMPDVILLDISMPVLDGLQALPLIKAAAPGTRVVMLSGLDDADIRSQALDLGAESYFLKTSDIGDVVEELAKLCPS